MKNYQVFFDQESAQVDVPSGSLVVEAAAKANLDLQQPCGGQGRCGRCVVQVTEGNVRRRSSLRLEQKDVDQGYALACQSVVEGDVHIHIPAQDTIEKRLVTTHQAHTISLPASYDPSARQNLKRFPIKLPPPSMDDQTDDWARLRHAFFNLTGLTLDHISLPVLQQLGDLLRDYDWAVTLVVETAPKNQTRLVSVLPGVVDATEPLWGIAIDIGTTTVTVCLVDLVTGEVKAQAAEYNGQIKRGEDVISRIIYAAKDNHTAEMQALVIETINQLIDTVCKRATARPEEIYKATIAGNSSMIHLLLAIPASSIRLSPFITAANQPPLVHANQIGLNIYPYGIVDCLPGVASYVGADITAGALSSGIIETQKTTLFMDIGTNGEIVLGSSEWLATCACSAGPAFEGAGVLNGMRATAGAIEEIWINPHTYEPTIRTIGGKKARGLCGSGLIALLAEMFLVGISDKSGNINIHLDTPRTRQGKHGGEYVAVWEAESGIGQDIVITEVDIDNLMRAKAAIFAGYSVLANQVGVPLESVEQILIGGTFGQYINAEKAIQIGLLPDLPWEEFHFLGNTAIQGAYRALIDSHDRQKLNEVAGMMTYIELSADNSFYEAFTSALFLPHTDLSRFPSVAQLLSQSAEDQPLAEAKPAGD